MLLDFSAEEMEFLSHCVGWYCSLIDVYLSILSPDAMIYAHAVLVTGIKMEICRITSGLSFVVTSLK